MVFLGEMDSLGKMGLLDQPDLQERQEAMVNQVEMDHQDHLDLRVEESLTSFRWGKMSCPTEVGTELIYDGFTGASRFSEPGGASNYLCMPKDPEYKSDLNYRSSKDGYSVVYMNTQCTGHMMTMLHVHYVSLPTDHLSSLSQPNIAAHQDGQESTMATSCPRGKI